MTYICCAANTRIDSSLEAYFFELLHGGLFERKAFSRELKTLLVVGHVPFEIDQPISTF